MSAAGCREPGWWRNYSAFIPPPFSRLFRSICYHQATEPQAKELTMKKIILIGLAATVVACALLFIFVINPDAEAKQAEFGALAAVCAGTGVPAAAAYPAAAPARLISFGLQSGEFALSNHAPLDWKAGALEDTALVLCMPEDKQELIQTCDYSGDKQIKRFVHVQAVELRAARTGAVVGTAELTGAEPEKCDTKEILRSDVVERTGDKVSSEQLKSWLESYVLGQ
jgi:hypothetical protein